MCTWKLWQWIFCHISSMHFNLIYEISYSSTLIRIHELDWTAGPMPIYVLSMQSDFMDQHNHEKTKVWCSMNNLSFNLQCNSYTEQRYWLHFTEQRFLRSYFPLSRTASSKLFSLIAFCTACVWNEQGFHFIILIVPSRH